MKIYVGFDSKEKDAYQATIHSLKHHSDIIPEPLNIEKLQSCGLFNRIVDNRDQMYDLPSNAPCSTEFATSRFLVPLICQSGWALFVDCDVIFMDDPAKILALADDSKAVMVVKHEHHGAGKKMGGVVQTSYPRKNWSSVMLINCDHPSNKRLTVHDVNNRPGRDLHAFYWLDDSEIGELPHEWNWLVNVTEKPDQPKIAHFTQGGPWIEGWQLSKHDEIWLTAAGWCFDPSKIHA